ncbi:hypothetical protein [Nocardia gipuzkoensis]|uniref:hypothetical protein n=1 Tax=Nocardia gipuzkoensis TaxID=2749991 RepID=UPI00237EADA8|nr:hypothetical protein [Nocardia gipuzkoensis]MDE1675144.1 hypothetical protein [Nocardia gipuzkoensis]
MIASGITGGQLGLDDGLVTAGVHVERSGTPIAWRILPDQTNPQRHRIAVWPATELVLDLPYHDSDTAIEQVSLWRYTPTRATQQWHFLRQ